jgi:hypothetical protein
MNVTLYLWYSFIYSHHSIIHVDKFYRNLKEHPKKILVRPLMYFLFKKFVRLIHNKLTKSYVYCKMKREEKDFSDFTNKPE